MDYAPDYRYYTSDVTRLWPVSGTFSAEHAALYDFIVAYRDALFAHIKPGVTSGEHAELREAKKRIRLLEQENEVLRRAAAYLSQANLPGK